MPKVTVAVQQGLGEIKAKLEEEGFQVVDIADTRADIAAMVYSSSIEPWAYEAGQAGEDSLTAGTGSSEGFVLMLNAAEMDSEEIVARVRQIR